MSDSASPDLSRFKIVVGLPPNFDAIDKVFQVRKHMRGRAVFFCYGNILYSPSGMRIPPQILVHEATHSMQQAKIGVEEWWDRYLKDVPFRFEQEVEAHRNEYRQVVINASRQVRRFQIKEVAQRLSGPLYGRMVTLDNAKILLQEPV